MTPEGRAAPAEAASAAGSRTQPFDPGLEEGLLVVLPHPDDESFSVGGTLLRAAEAGVRSTYLCGTYGDMGRRLGRPAFTNREALRDVRTEELKEACRVLGCDLRFMGLRDKCIEFEDPHEVAARITATITELEPSAVFTFYPGYGVHPDHDALGHATVLAVRALPAAERPRLLAVAIGDRERLLAELGEPDLVCDIEGHGDGKLAALRAHRSQTEAMFAHWDEEAAQASGAPGAEAAGDAVSKAEDDQARAFREEFTKRERFYLLDPDAPTLLETGS